MEEREEKDMAEEMLSRGEGWIKSSMKEDISKTLVIAPAVCVTRALSLSFCVHLSESLILLTKHVVSWKPGLGP